MDIDTIKFVGKSQIPDFDPIPQNKFYYKFEYCDTMVNEFDAIESESNH